MRMPVLQSALTVGGRRIKVAVLDHVVSFPPLVLPVAAMAAACKQASCRTVARHCRITGISSFCRCPSVPYPRVAVAYARGSCDQLHRGHSVRSRRDMSVAHFCLEYRYTSL